MNRRGSVFLQYVDDFSTTKWLGEKTVEPCLHDLMNDGAVEVSWDAYTMYGVVCCCYFIIAIDIISSIIVIFVEIQKCIHVGVNKLQNTNAQL